MSAPNMVGSGLGRAVREAVSPVSDHQERVAARNRYAIDSGHLHSTLARPQERNTFQDVATALGSVSFATIHCDVPKSFASLRTLVP